MGAVLTGGKVIMLMDRGARWPSWLSRAPKDDSIQVHVRQAAESWEGAVSRSVPALGPTGGATDRPTLIVSVSTGRAAQSAIRALEDYLSSGQVDVVLVAPEVALSPPLLRRIEELRRIGGGTLQLETRPPLEQRGRPLPPMSVARAALERSADGALR